MISMNKKILISILVGLIILISTFILVSNTLETQILNLSHEIDFTYSDVEKIQKSLAEKNISVSTPAVITDSTTDQYCTYFDDTYVKKSVTYCKTSAIITSGKTIGNLNIGGTSDRPMVALAIVDSSPFLNSNKDEVAIVFQTIIETLVCDCWEIRQPGGFESVSDWLDTAEEKYSESSRNTLKSEINGINNKRLILEITFTEKSYLWTLIVLK